MFHSASAEEGVVDNVSRPLIALLVSTVALFALYFVAFRGGSPSTSDGTSKQSLGAFSSDIAAAHHAVTTSNHASAAQGSVPGSSSGSSSSSTSTKTTAASATAHKSATGSKAKSTTTSKTTSKATRSVTVSHSTSQNSLKTVDRALTEKKVLALLFYNPAASDDRAVKQELRAVPTHKGHVVKLAVPINQLGNYEGLTNEVPINESPTLVLISGNGQASTIVGFADGFEISQRVADAMAVK